MKDSNYDVIIIGSGMGGLGTGIYLQAINTGLKSIIVEQHIQPGGYVTGFKRKGFYFDGGAEGFMGMGDNGNLRSSLKAIGFNHEFIKEDPLEHYYYQDKQFSLFTDRNKLISEVERKFPEQLVEFKRFLERCEAITIEMQEGKEIPESNLSYYDFISKYITSDEIIDIFNLFCLWFGATADETPAYLIAHIINGVLQNGVYYPKGGMQSFSDHLADFYVKNGGKIFYKSMVETIIVEDEKVTGIKLQDGSIIRGKYVVSNADVKRTILQYTGEKHFPKEYWRTIEELRQSVTGIMLFLAVDMDLSNYPSHFQIGKDFKVIENTNKGEFNSNKLAVRIPSNIDSSLKTDKGTAFLSFIFQPYNWNNYWNSGADRIKGEDYKNLKEEIADRMIAQLETVIPDLRSKILIKELATPLTFERYVQVTDGAWFGPFSFQNLPDFKTPIKNLFLVGSSVKGSGAPSALRSGLELGKHLLDIYE